MRLGTRSPAELEQASRSARRPSAEWQVLRASPAGGGPADAAHPDAKCTGRGDGAKHTTAFRRSLVCIAR